MKPCVCGRAPRGFAFRTPGDPYAETHPACSMKCLDFLARSKGEPPVNLAPIEADAIMAASEAIGGHLEKLGKTDAAVRVMLTRSLKKLQQVLGEEISAKDLK